MLEILYRIYEVPSESEKQRNMESANSFGMYSISKAENVEIAMDCLICESRERFKEIIRSQYENIAFKFSRKMKEGDLYCVIIGENCYDTEKYFNKVKFKCDCCGSEIETYIKKKICFSDWEIRDKFYNIEEYQDKAFCSERCKEIYTVRELRKIKPDGEHEFFIQRDMFTENVSGYIYKITKKTTGEFYIGQTKYAPIFRWGQHLKTDRFPISDIENYKFETLYIVPCDENILLVEKDYITRYASEFPKLCLNVIHNSGAEA